MHQAPPPRKKRPRKRKGAVPKGAYRLPTGGYVVEGKPANIGNRRIRVIAVHKDKVDVERMARILLTMINERNNPDTTDKESDPAA